MADAWLRELFTAPALERLRVKRGRDDLLAVPYFDGLMAGEPGALVKSFAGEPELHDPVRGRVKGTRAFEGFVTGMSSWLTERNDVGLLARCHGATRPRPLRFRQVSRTRATIRAEVEG